MVHLSNSRTSHLPFQLADLGGPEGGVVHGKEGISADRLGTRGNGLRGSLKYTRSKPPYRVTLPLATRSRPSSHSAPTLKEYLGLTAQR